MPAFFRTLTPFVRTARAAVKQGNSVSPLAQALQRRNGVDAFRAYAAAFQRDKPHVNIGTLYRGYSHAS